MLHYDFWVGEVGYLCAAVGGATVESFGICG